MRVSKLVTWSTALGNITFTHTEASLSPNISIDAIKPARKCSGIRDTKCKSGREALLPQAPIHSAMSGGLSDSQDHTGPGGLTRTGAMGSGHENKSGEHPTAELAASWLLAGPKSWSLAMLADTRGVACGRQRSHRGSRTLFALT